MLNHYVKFFFRFIKRTRLYFLINLFGLGFSTCCAILLAAYYSFHLSFDKFHDGSDRIVRVTMDSMFGTEELKEATTMYPLAPALEEDFPEVEKTVRLFDPNLFDKAIIVTKDETSFKEPEVLYADSTFFDVFSFELKEGSRSKCLVEPKSIVLTEKSAKKYFGDKPAIGETILVGGAPHVVTAIAKNPPANSHFTFDFMVSLSGMTPGGPVWVNTPLYTYARLHAASDIEKIQSKMDDFSRRHVAADLEKFYNTTYDNLKKAGGKLDFILQPIEDIHLHSNLDTELTPNESYDRISILGAIAIFIVIIASINFINLTTALGNQRAKEIGVKKMFGSVRYQLIAQFLTESVLYALAGVALGLVFAFLLAPLFSILMNSSVNLFEFFTLERVIVLLVFVLILGGVSGLYPALFMSGLKPISVLKGNTFAGSGDKRFRDALVVFQFSISIFLIACSGIFYKQLNYMMSVDPGFNKDQILIVKNIGKLKDKLSALKTEVERIPDVRSSSASREIPSAEFQTMLSKPEGFDRPITFAYFMADEDFLETYGLSIVDGRNFGGRFSADSTGAAIVNEALMKEISQESSLGKSIDAKRTRPIVGVIKDFHFQTLRTKIQPLAIFYRFDGKIFDYLSIRYGSSNTAEVVSKVESVWKELADGLPFEYEFLDEHLANQYQQETSFYRVATVFTLISIVISCLGLVGLITFAIKKREKEISIRKVLGSSVVGIQGLFAKDIVVLIAISTVLSIPTSAWFLDNWLNEFSYRTTLDPLVFVAAVMAMCVVTFGAVIYFTLKAAFVNPIDALRSE